jgi:hypothetical protein
MDKVEGPPCIGPRLDKDRGPCAKRLAARFAFTDRQPFLAVEPVDAVDARRLALAPEQDEQPSVANRRRSLARSCNRPRSAVSGARWDWYRTIFRSAPAIWHARRSDSPNRVFSCATASRFTAGTAIFLTVTPSWPPYRASARPTAALAPAGWLRRRPTTLASTDQNRFRI